MKVETLLAKPPAYPRAVAALQDLGGTATVLQVTERMNRHRPAGTPEFEEDVVRIVLRALASEGYAQMGSDDPQNGSARFSAHPQLDRISWSQIPRSIGASASSGSNGSSRSSKRKGGQSSRKVGAGKETQITDSIEDPPQPKMPIPDNARWNAARLGKWLSEIRPTGEFEGPELIASWGMPEDANMGSVKRTLAVLSRGPNPIVRRRSVVRGSGAVYVYSFIA